jgi:S-adenosylmethionine:tRNA ribosyltransferase-isomerase
MSSKASGGIPTQTPEAVFVDVSDFDFDLPDELIAQEPAPARGGSRLLVMDRASGRVAHHHFSDLPTLLRAGDLLVVNDTRVFPARLIGTRLGHPTAHSPRGAGPGGGGGRAECFLVHPAEEPDTWIALVHPGQRLREGSRMKFEGDGRVLNAEVVGRHFHGRRTVRLWTDDGSPVRETVDAIGHIPLPPYIKRPDAPSDRDRYQTIYARERGSIAAPTAGLHFTPQVLDELGRRGVERATVTLHVGYGTFQPVRVERVEDHQVEREHYEVPPATAAALTRARRDARRVIAVGTTTTRTLESLTVTSGGDVLPGAGQTDLFIYPGFEFKVVSGLITNFHLPKSSLLMLVSAFAGRERLLAAYREAIAERYRFYSYGDAMLVV